MKPTVSLSHSQHLTLTPQLQQAIRLLQLSNQALELEINALCDKNPFLERLSEAGNDAHQDVQEIKTALAAANGLLKETEARALSEFRHERDLPGKSSESAYDFSIDHQEWLNNRERKTTLKDHLIWQLNMGGFSENERLMAILLIEEINDEGYFLGTFQESQTSFIQMYPDQESITLEEIEILLQKIQRFDPIGVGARSFLECLSIQLLSMPKNTPWLKETLHALQYLDDIRTKNYARLKKKINISEEGITAIFKLLKILNPKPGLSFQESDFSENLIPDLIVRKEDTKSGRFIVTLNTRELPKLRLNPEYIQFMNRHSTHRSHALLKEHYNEAKNFLNGLLHREEILLKVAEQIVEFQKDFFEEGPVKLHPLILQTIAKRTGFHESTISRITSQKTLYCAKGLFNLKYFFSGKAYINNGAKTAQYSTKAVQAEVKKIIEAESITNPYTDDTIKKKLDLLGIFISRRTVTKYREKMRILSSNERRTSYLFKNAVTRRNV